MSEQERRGVNSRKRKKSFLKNARKYGKKGCYGRGNQLDPDTYQYLIQIMEKYNEGFDSAKEQSCFVNSFFKRTENAELDYCRNQVGCRVVESLLPLADEIILERYMTAFSTDLRPLCSDRFASHVLESLVVRSCEICLNKSNLEETREKSKTFFLKVSRFLLNNMEDYIWDQCGNHILRTCIGTAAQLPHDEISDKKKQKNISESVSIDELPDEFKELVKDCGERLLAWPQFPELCSTELTSGFLQVLLKASNKVDSKLTKKYIKEFMNCFDSSNVCDSNEDHGDSNSQKAESASVPRVFLSTPIIALLETSLQVAGSKSYRKIYENYFKNRLAMLAETRMTNFAVQKLLTKCNDKSQFESMYDELAEHIPKILQAGHTGVILALAQTCKRLIARQGNFVKSLMKSLDCAEPEARHDSFILCLARLKPYDESAKHSNENLQKEKLNLHGTLILQALLEFNKPINFINSLLNMDTNDLKNLLSNTMGSHIVDSFIKSQYIGEKSRERLIRKLKGMYQDLAATKYGSRSFEAMWNVASLKNKLLIMDELACKDGAWSNTPFGMIIANKVHLSLYKRNKENWKENLNKKKVDAKDVFASVLK